MCDEFAFDKSTLLRVRLRNAIQSNNVHEIDLCVACGADLTYDSECLIARSQCEEILFWMTRRVDTVEAMVRYVLLCAEVENITALEILDAHLSEIPPGFASDVVLGVDLVNFAIENELSALLKWAETSNFA